MDTGSVRFLSGPAGARALAAARQARALPVHRRAKALAGLGSAEEIRWALVQDDLRVRAADRCPHADVLFFAHEALEQATAWPVAAERAARWPGPGPLTDLGAGMGLDALAVALSGRRVVAYERDPMRAALLAANARALDVEARIEVRCEDVFSAQPTGTHAYLDPDRRAGGVRTRDPARFEPPRALWDGLLARFERAIVKLPPVVEGEIPDGPQEVVSLGGRARERRLYVGDWPGRLPRRALALPSGRSIAGAGAAWPAVRAVGPGAWLFDPDVSVTLAGLVGDLAARDGLAAAHESIAYLVADAPVEAAPGHWMRVTDVLPAKPKALNAWLRTHAIGALTIRTRGLEAKAAEWRRKLKPAGPNAGTLVFTRSVEDRWVAYGCADGP